MENWGLVTYRYAVKILSFPPLCSLILGSNRISFREVSSQIRLSKYLQLLLGFG